MKNKVLMIVLAGFLLVGCGSSNKTSTTSGDIGTGTYVDSAVDGARYECGNQSGITGDTGIKGGFKYEKGQPCTFSINGIELSKVLGDKLNADNVEIKVGDDDVAVFLQSLDMDGNAENGITIDSKIVEVLAQNGKATLPTTPAEVQAIVNLLSSAGIGYNGSAITKKDAQMHMAGFSLSMSVTKLAILEGEEVSFAADIESDDNQGFTYEWVGFSETSSYFTKDDFSAGEHTVVVNVTKGGITLSARQTIEVTPGSEFIVSITGGQSNYNTEDNVMLEANITGNAGATQTYVWKDGDTALTGTSKILTKKFAAGSHSVTVDVTGNGITKSASFDFNVSDLTDFNIFGSTIGQISTGLMWVNELDISKNACLVIHGDVYNETVKDGNFENAKTFCNLLDFASFTNWRTPETTELSDYIKKTNEVNIETKYAGGKTCPQLLSIIADADGSQGANYRAVTTRFMDTNYFPNVGTIRDHTYATDANKTKKYNVGLRCVRNTDGSGGEDIPGANIVVSITGAKSNYVKNETVILDINVTGSDSATVYAWRDNHLKWKDDKSQGSLISNASIGGDTIQLSQVFAVGHHTITAIATVDGVDKNSTISFDVSDWSDFNRTFINNDRVLIQKSENLMWVDETDLSKGACAKIHANTDENLTKFATEFEAAKSFCATLNDKFTGLSGWRIPTATESKLFIEASIAANTISFYDAKCGRVLAYTGTNQDLNSSYSTVTTRYSSTAGVISNGGELVPNIGLRCVRPQ